MIASETIEGSAEAHFAAADERLVVQLCEGDAAAVAQLLALNPVSLVHRVCVEGSSADSALLMYARAASAAQKEALICALLAAVDQYRSPAPDLRDMETLAAAFGSLVAPPRVPPRCGGTGPIEMPELDVDALYAAAGKGDRNAQAALVQFALRQPDRGVCTAQEAVCAVEMTARLAATSGKPSDLFTLVGVLMIRAQHMIDRGSAYWSRAYKSEAAALLAMMADAGNDEAAAYLATILTAFADEGDEAAGAQLQILSDRLGPDAMKAAANFERLLTNPEGSA